MAPEHLQFQAEFLEDFRAFAFPPSGSSEDIDLVVHQVNNH